MYTSRITRAAPSAFVLLIDQSRSMQERILFNSSMMTKAEAVAWAANATLSELVNRSRREEGVRDYFHVSALGYGGAGVYPLVGGTPKGMGMIAVSRLASVDVPRRSFLRERTLPDGHTMITTATQKSWIEPRAEGSTPMVAALDAAGDILNKWCRTKGHENSFPPVAINITDGEAGDGGAEELLAAAAKLRSLATGDGNVLLLNIHITAGGSGAPVLFPSDAAQLGEAGYGRLLFEMSSAMPRCYDQAITAIKGPPAGSGQHAVARAGATGNAVPAAAAYRGMSYNCPVTELLSMLDIGTVSVNLIR